MVGHGAEVRLNNVEGWSRELPAHSRDIWFDTLTNAFDPEAVIHFMMPNRCHPDRAKPNFNYTMFEAAGIPADWVWRAKHYRRVVVPTESCREAWVRSGVEESRVRVCPLGVGGEYFSQTVEPLALWSLDGRPVSSFTTRFLNIAELRPRKNHIGLLRTWIRATRAEDDAVLILKCTSTPSLFDLFGADLADMQAEIGRSFTEAAPVILLTSLMSDEEMRGLYHTATHYISMSHGEGWDLPMMEAATAGLQLIAPDHSGYRTYLTPHDAEMIPAVETPASFDGRVGREDAIFFHGLSWWRPDEESAGHAIARAVRGGEVPKFSPAERIRQEFTWARAGARLLQIIGE